MVMTTTERINKIIEVLRTVDIFSNKFNKEIQEMINMHRKQGGSIEYVYVQHYYNEIHGLSQFFQYLLRDNGNRRYTFFAVRAAMEILLQLEYVFRLKKLGDDKVFVLLSKDVAQSVAATNAAAPPDPNHSIHAVVRKFDDANKILKTSFDLNVVKSNTKPFPDIHSLCEKSAVTIKNYRGIDIYHLYVMYSEPNHVRLISHNTTSRDNDYKTCLALEIFIEIYVRFYELILKTNGFPIGFSKELKSIKDILGL